MKKVAIIVLIMIFLVSTVGVLAEGTTELPNEKGYYVYDGITPMYSVLRGKEWNVYAVIEYDREHFVRFSDPEKGFWGVGLKADSNPICSGGSFTFENVAVILLRDACYDYETESNFDVQITLDKVTYASCAGAEVNEKADVLGMFGYSREMETVGFLSGWGCQAIRNGENEIARTEDIWIVDDSAESDMPLLCTEVEFTVTAIRKKGTSIKPERVNGFYWTAADIDMLQAEGAAYGEAGKEYEAGYFDEGLRLREGFKDYYTVQEENYLEILSEASKNDSFIARGVLTGVQDEKAAQPGKSYTSAILSQQGEKARATWRGCGREEAPARTELTFSAGERKNKAPEEEEVLTDYTVRYLEEGTEKELAESKSVKGQASGSNVVEEAIEIENYDLAGEASQSITLVQDAAQNVITFCYKQAVTDYTVQYLEEGTEEQLAEPKQVKGETVGESVTETAVDIDNYDLVSELSQTRTLVRDPSENVITFYYKPQVNLSYVYLNAPDGSLTPPAGLTNIKSGSIVTLAVPEVTDYVPTDGEESYVVKYLNINNNEPLSEERVVNGNKIGDIVTEKAISIDGWILEGDEEQSKEIRSSRKYQLAYWYLDSACTQPAPSSLTIDADTTVYGQWINVPLQRNEFIFYYDEYVGPTTVAYTVQYLDRGTGLPILPDKYVTDVEPGTHVIEYPEQKEGYKPMQQKYEWDVVGNEVKIFLYYEYTEQIVN